MDYFHYQSGQLHCEEVPVRELAEKYGLSVYDAVYLEAALRLNLPLASRDEALRAAAKRNGVKLLG